jgi:hypothetical protein
MNFIIVGGIRQRINEEIARFETTKNPLPARPEKDSISE